MAKKTKTVTTVTDAALITLTEQEIPLETKLTRQELIDIVCDSVSDKLAAQIKVLREEFDELRSVDFSEVEGMFVVKSSGRKLNLRESYSDEKKVELCHGNVHIEFTGDAQKLFGARMKRWKVIEAQLNKLNEAKRRIETRKGRTEILRQLMSGTESGRDVLSRIGAFEISLEQRLLSTSDNS